MRKILYYSQKKNALWDALETCGNYEVSRIELSNIEARKEISEKLLVSLASKISYECRLVKVDGQPRIVIKDYYINPYVIQLIQNSILNYNRYSEIYHQFFTKITRCVEDTNVVAADREVAGLLQREADEEVLMISGKAYDQMDNIVEYYEYYILPEDFTVYKRFE